MAGTAPRLPEQFRSASYAIDFNVSELVSDAAGAHSPFGDLEFPQPVEKLAYELTDQGSGKVKLTLSWENHVASVPVTVK